MGPFGNNPALAKLKAAQANKPTMMTKTLSVAPTPTYKARSAASSSSPKPRPASKPAGTKSAVRQVARTSNSATPSRPASSEPVDRIRESRAAKHKRNSPAVLTPRLTSSDDDDEDSAGEPMAKRRRIQRKGSIDTKRRIRDLSSFSEEGQDTCDVIHAVDIANTEVMEQSRNKYGPFFTALMGDEDEAPTIELQYPSASQREKYQLVRPTDASDFKPVDEILENMKRVAEHYLDSESAAQITNEATGTGMVEALMRAAKRGLAGRVGAQSEFISVIQKYNNFLSRLRKDGTLARHVDEMTFIPLPLIEHIVKSQIYARTVSPHINSVRQYEGFSDNVYGELLPKFLSEIFAATHLKSDQVFVDLGSGVGNCVLQAALEIGCESWGCEIMENPARLANLQAKEFPARCRLWGLKPGAIHLIHDDFLANKEINEVLQRADVVLINNQAFTPALNDKLKYRFLDLKESCQIVSLKAFVDPGHKIKVTNQNDPINVLEVVRMKRFSGRVSWTDDPGDWFLSRKDSRRLREFMKERGQAFE